MLLKERNGRCSFCRSKIIGKPVLRIREIPSENSIKTETVQMELCSKECVVTEEVFWHVIVLRIEDIRELESHLKLEHGYEFDLIQIGLTRCFEEMNKWKHL